MNIIAVTVLLGGLLASAWSQTAEEKLPFLGGAGATRCDKWIETREEEATSILGFGLTGWVVGFVDGALNDKDLLSDFTENDVLTRVDFYCREHGSNLLYQAALVVT